ncbi:MAG TPA: acetyl-CoA carboxylase carboxyltransferase subunit alpha [bacterium]|jgi:acetyl-CoA carboxylase carboxyl transferase subunit alpha|nr:acetyl-CoA carboxylase carboxyltransferase subunit alpha [bacterium]
MSSELPDGSAWQTVQLARHPQRPRLSDLLPMLFTDLVELHGDRLYRDDPAVLTALARFAGRPVVVVGTYKGKDTKDNIAHNFGMPYPEGYRKALRAMRLAEKFGFPVVSLVDTPAAWPGDEAEERGQAEAIARSIHGMTRLRTPIAVVITGEGGSGGALAIGVGDVVMMLQHAIYTVIPPEGCAAILWHDSARAPEAAAALRLTAADLLALGVIDEILPEPAGGAHADHEAAADAVRAALTRALSALDGEPIDMLLERRYNKYRAMGRVIDSTMDGDGGGRSEARL